ncbi:MAG: hypothetical protein Q9M17_02145 [Mariprofundus sp.]|nr:hypothetical protein [Mariprofundus sp.]
MHASEVISLSWMIFFFLFAIAAYFFADRDRNNDRIEWMKAVIFANIIAISMLGALTPEFIAYTLDIPWRTNSSLNTTVTIVGLITSWAIMQWAVEWLAGLAVLVLVSGAISWIAVHLIGF